MPAKEEIKVINILKNRSVQTIFLIAIYTISAPHLNADIHRLLYTVSLFIKDVLILLMPITVGVFIASTIDSFERKAPIFVLILIVFEGCSNFLSVCYAYVLGYIVSSQLPILEITTLSDHFLAFWRMPFIKPSWWGPDKGCLVGMIIGGISAFVGSHRLKTGLYKARNIAEMILTQVFSRLIPIYAIGCIAQIYKTGFLDHMILHYSVFVMYLVMALILYMFVIFVIGNGFRLCDAMNNIKNLLPSGIVSFTSGCSLATMPWTIKGVSQNLKNPEFAKLIIPATTNVQMIGDSISNAFLCFLLYKNFFGYNPDILTWSAFTIVFVATRFATAAVQGGAIFLMIPIYQNYLSFNEEMIAVMLAMNVILDPIITSSNVMCNGALAKVFENIWGYFDVKKE